MSKRPAWRKGIKDVPSESESSSILSNILTSADEIRDADPKKSTIYVFQYTVNEFAKKLVSWYPETKEFKDFLDQQPETDAVDEEKVQQLAYTFNDKFKSYTKLVLQKDLDFLEHPDFLYFQVKEKYEACGDQEREIFWEMFRNLLQYASMIEMYSGLPSGMMSSITNMAGTMMNKLQKGEMDLASLNPMQIGEMMMQNINQEELESFAKNMLQGGNLENMMSLMQQSLGSSELGGMLDMIKKQNS